MAPTETVTAKRGYSVDEIAREYGLHPMFIRKEIWSNRLRATRFGRRVVILKSDWDSYVKSRPTNVAQ